MNKERAGLRRTVLPLGLTGATIFSGVKAVESANANNIPLSNAELIAMGAFAIAGVIYQIRSNIEISRLESGNETLYDRLMRRGH